MFRIVLPITGVSACGYGETEPNQRIPQGVRFVFCAGHSFGKLFLKKWDEAAAFGGTDAAAPVCNLKKHLDAAGRHVAFFRESLIWKKLDFCGIA